MNTCVSSVGNETTVHDDRVHFSYITCTWFYEHVPSV